jgi:hypothetical protein
VHDICRIRALHSRALHSRLALVAPCTRLALPSGTSWVLPVPERALFVAKECRYNPLFLFVLAFTGPLWPRNGGVGQKVAQKERNPVESTEFLAEKFCFEMLARGSAGTRNRPCPAPVREGCVGRM